METSQPPAHLGAPATIRIKRKREDHPIDNLYIEHNKRRATDHGYVFKRIDQERQPAVIFRQEYEDSGIPKIRSTPEGEEKRNPYALGITTEPQSPSPQKKAQNNVLSPRRFHLSRAMSASAAAKGRSDVAIFVERRLPMQKVPNASTTSTMNGAGTVQMPLRKRPTARTARSAPNQAGTTTFTSTPMVDAVVANKMDQWSHVEAQAEAEAEAQSQQHSPGHEADAMDLDNEADYVYDTYYRSALAAGEKPGDKGVSFGHLVIDEEHEDLWETYLDGEESDDKEFETDGEDSNAEDYYGADYPEDEVASDDEYDRNVYQYRKQGDDLEEFDVHERETYEIDDDGLIRSDDEDDYGELEAARAWKRDFGNKPRAKNMVL